MGTKKGQRRKTARRAYEFRQSKRRGSEKRLRRSDRREVRDYWRDIEVGKNLGNMTNAAGRWVRARFRMFD